VYTLAQSLSCRLDCGHKNLPHRPPPAEFFKKINVIDFVQQLIAQLRLTLDESLAEELASAPEILADCFSQRVLLRVLQ